MAFPTSLSDGALPRLDVVRDANPASNSFRYRGMLKEVDNGLGERDMDKLKYLCYDLGVAPRKFESMKRGIHLFAELEKLALITPDDISLLVMLMQTINRFDLVKKLKSWSTKEGSLAQFLSEYRQLMLRISDNLNRDEREQLIFYLNDSGSPLPVTAIEESKTMLQLFAQMERYMMMGPDDVSYLVDIMKSIGNFAIVKEIEKYQASSHMSASESYKSQQPSSGFTTQYSTQKRSNSEPSFDTYAQNPNATVQTFNSAPQPQDLTQQQQRWQQEYQAQQGCQQHYPQHHQVPQHMEPTLQERQFQQEQLALQQKQWEQQQKQQLLMKQVQLQQQQAQQQASTLQSQAAEGRGGSTMSTGPRRPDWYYQAVQKSGQAYAEELWDRILAMTNEDLQRKMHNLQLSPGSTSAETAPSIKTETNDDPDHVERTQNPEMAQHVETREENRTQEPQQGNATSDNRPRVVPAQTAVYANRAERDAVLRQPPAILPRYTMNRRPRGLCVIFNAKNFLETTGYSKRDGTDKDVEKLLNMFQNRLMFKTAVVQDPTGRDYISNLQKIQEMDHSEYDCFACVILSHGSKDNVHGIDGTKVQIVDITGLFRGSYCPSLSNKPKMFFIQACQGNDPQSAVEIQQDATATIPNDSDILISLSTVPGYSSNRSVTQGSWYISTLCHVVNTYHQTVDLLSMLTMVNDMLSKAADKQNTKQIGMPSHTFRKQVFFNE